MVRRNTNVISVLRNMLFNLIGKLIKKLVVLKSTKCACRTLFSRRDSFITHRAFCDALAEESAKVHTILPNPKPEEVVPISYVKHKVVVSSPPPPPPPPLSPLLPLTPPPAMAVLPEYDQIPELPKKSTGILQQIPPSCVNGSTSSSSSSSNLSSNNSLFESIFSSSTMAGTLQPQTSAFSDLICAMLDR